MTPMLPAFQMPPAGLMPPMDMMMEDEIPLSSNEGVIEIDAATGEVRDVDPSQDPPPPPSLEGIPFEANIALHLPDDKLSKIGVDALHWLQEDLQARDSWEQMARKAIESLPLKSEKKTEPFEGACGARHPMMLQSAITFNSQAMGQIFPASGPVTAVVIVKMTPDKAAQAQRVTDHMNYVLMNEVKGYREDTDTLTMQYSIIGGGYRKWSLDQARDYSARYIPAEDFVMNYGASGLDDAIRFSHLFKLSPTAAKSRQLEDQSPSRWLDVELQTPSAVDQGPVKDAKDAAATLEQTGEYGYHRFAEMYVDLVIDPVIDKPSGLPSPYIVTMERDSGKVLAIMRNWDPADPLRKRMDNITRFYFIPGFGPYGIGLYHTQGQIQEAVTALMRNCVNAAAYQMFGSGYSTLRTNKITKPPKPGEFIQIEGSIEDLQKSFYMIPKPQLGPEVLPLLQMLVGEGKDLGSWAQNDIKNVGGETAFATILALIERNMLIPSAVIARLHASLTKEFQIVQRLIKTKLRLDGFGDADEVKYLSNEKTGVVKLSDYDDTITIRPTSDPNASTYAQRIMKYQTLITTLQQMPPQVLQGVDMRQLLIQLATVLGIREAETFIPPKEEIPPRDPIGDITAILKGDRVKVYEWQPHEAYFAAAQAAIQDPKTREIVGQSPNGQQAMSQLMAYSAERYAYIWRANAIKQFGTPLPPQDQPMDPETASSLAGGMAQAIHQLTESNIAEMQAKKNQKMTEDPLLMAELAEKQAKAKQAEAGAQAALMHAETERMRVQGNFTVAREQIEAKLTALNDEKEEAERHKIVAETLKLIREIELMGKAPAVGENS